METVLHVTYAVCQECQMEDIYYDICIKCGKCGRKFDNYGLLIDDGGTTFINWED